MNKLRFYKTKEISESRAMQEVREWKSLRDAEVAHLPPPEAIRRMMELADERARPLIERMMHLKVAGKKSIASFPNNEA